MPSITLTDPVAHTLAIAGLIATNNGNLRTLLNAGLDYANLKGSPSLASGEVPVWNGTQFDRSTTTKIGATSLGTGTPDSAKFLRGDGSWQAISGYGTSLPGSPVDGQEHVLVDSTTLPTYQWRFRYNNGSSNTDKWEFIGGARAESVVNTSENTSSVTDVDLATVGPSFTVPRAGVYEVSFGFMCLNNVAAANASCNLYKNAGLVQGLQSGFQQTASTGNYVTGNRNVRLSGVAASDVLKLKYSISNSVSVNFLNRWMMVSPVRVS